MSVCIGIEDNFCAFVCFYIDSVLCMCVHVCMLVCVCVTYCLQTVIRSKVEALGAVLLHVVLLHICLLFIHKIL